MGVIESFPTINRTPPAHKEIRVILDFYWSGIKLLIWLLAFLLAITYIRSVQMGHTNPFWTFKFQEISNDIRNSSIQWVLTLAISIWRFENPSGLRLPKWGLTWECEGSFPHILLHSWEHEMWLLGFPLGLHPCKPLPWSRAQGKGYDIYDAHVNFAKNVMQDHGLLLNSSVGS